MGGNERPRERKATKRNGKQKANNTIVEMVITHFKDYSNNNNEMKEVLTGL